MTKIAANPCYGADGKIVDIDLDKVVLHTVTGERMTEAFFERLAIEAEDEQKGSAIGVRHGPQQGGRNGCRSSAQFPGTL